MKHGHTKEGKESPTYRSWKALRMRVRHPERNVGYANPNIILHPRYDNFENFLADVGPRPTLKHSIDRYPDPNGGYVPGNLRWATPAQQSSNRRSSKFTFEQAVLLALERLTGSKYKEISKRWNCSENLPREIIKGRAWRGAVEEAQKRLNATAQA